MHREGGRCSRGQLESSVQGQARCTFSQSGAFQTTGSMKKMCLLVLCFIPHLSSPPVVKIPEADVSTVFGLSRGPLRPLDPASLIGPAPVAHVASSSTQSCRVQLCRLCIA